MTLNVDESDAIETASLSLNNLVVSSLACSNERGSESLVAYRLLEHIQKLASPTCITSSAMKAPEGCKQIQIDVPCGDPNDVAPWDMLQFERKQLKHLKRLASHEKIDCFHRLTPSGVKETLLSKVAPTIIVGPVLLGQTPPASFQPIFSPRISDSLSFPERVRRLKNGLARRYFSRFSTLSAFHEQADLIFAGTQITYDLMPVALQKKCRVVSYAGVESEVFTPPLRDRKQHRTTRLLYVGRLIAYKGVELLLRSFALARKRCNLALDLVGGGNQRYLNYCKAIVARLGIADFVTFHSPRNRADLVDAYRGADIFCLPSTETYGLALLEAMSCGCAVLVADFNGPGEIVPIDAGVKVPLIDIDQFTSAYAERMVELAASSSQRIKLGAIAREHVVKKHNWSGIAQQIIEGYQSLLLQPSK